MAAWTKSKVTPKYKLWRALHSLYYAQLRTMRSDGRRGCLGRESWGRNHSA